MQHGCCLSAALEVWGRVVLRFLPVDCSGGEKCVRRPICVVFFFLNFFGTVMEVFFVYVYQTRHSV
jgi:hypothetical protein